MATLSSYPSPSSSSHPAEALLIRARQLSNNAYSRSVPTAFAEGEDINLSSLPSPTSASRTSATLHQLHHTSFNDLVRDHSRRRSSIQRLSSSTSTAPTTEARTNSTSSSFSSITTSQTIHQSEHHEQQSKQKNISEPYLSPDELPPSHGRDNNNEHIDNNDKLTQTFCATSLHQPNQKEPQRHSLTIDTRPRALTTESIQEKQENIRTCATFDNTGFPHSGFSTKSSIQRRHHSENGTERSGRLVLDILKALRDSDQLISASPPISVAQSVSSSTNISKPIPATAGSSSPSESTSQYASVTTSAATADLLQTSQNSPITQRARAESMPIVPSPVATPRPLSTQLNRASPSPSAAPSAASLSGPASDYVRRNNHSESIDNQEDTRSTQSNVSGKDTSVSTGSGNSSGNTTGSESISQSPVSMSPDMVLPPATVTASKSSKRSSKLFGKLVPRFLQTSSLGPAGGSSSSKSAFPVSSSPLSAASPTTPMRPSRSASFAGGASSPMVATKKSAALSTLPAVQEKKAPPSLPLPDSILESEKDWLDALGKDSKMENDTPSESGLTTPSTTPSSTSASSTTSVKANTTILASALAASSFSMTSPSLSSRKTSYSSSTSKSTPLTTPLSPASPTSPAKLEVSFDELVEIDEGVDVGIEPNCAQDNLKNSRCEDQNVNQEPSSPYIIDDDCDDDFFLNSVLRKKNSQNHDQPKTLPKLTTTWSSGRTLSLSTSFSSSSQTSSTSPSPTTPKFIHPGLDEKRARLSDAVKEWRRSANTSSGSFNSTTAF
ncbi:hypothetical protein BX616_000995 [Lobosporangium transversale]|uniref:Uncharacterized protein n=1 Tax=Lobosporangium transversale TaxID=64571 RepID=A0A1Y2GL21_9FUNG|nr:hypothetical protein BCR41DRAFT_423298 [Lobosporangium transversale]KAF9905521.1 hypothetical protein BX616_000995 [Lobosporangium transversale]ORZ12109.1 hypothetical protein BCR41DRAFT_423298 [Lobosporangium transversale]|eukprot:XP_021879974.1 hypothetical protein BCR41DRAFT_423298 [Lobosporangium transversale]